MTPTIEEVDLYNETRKFPLAYDSTVDPVVVRETELMAEEAKNESRGKANGDSDSDVEEVGSGASASEDTTESSPRACAFPYPIVLVPVLGYLSKLSSNAHLDKNHVTSARGAVKRLCDSVICHQCISLFSTIFTLHHCFAATSARLG
jgi:hypothetical protein